MDGPLAGLVDVPVYWSVVFPLLRILSSICPAACIWYILFADKATQAGTQPLALECKDSHPTLRQLVGIHDDPGISCTSLGNPLNR